jgi:hypothetical protein
MEGSGDVATRSSAARGRIARFCLPRSLQRGSEALCRGRAHSRGMHHAHVQLEVGLHVEVPNDLAVEPCNRTGHDRRAEHADLVRVGQEGIVTEPAIGSEHTRKRALVGVEHRECKGPAVADQRRQRVPLLHRDEQHRRVRAALLHTIDDAAVAHITKRRRDEELPAGHSRQRLQHLRGRCLVHLVGPST